MAKVRISKVIISEDNKDAVVLLDSGDELIVSSVLVNWPSVEELPKVTVSADILHGVVKPLPTGT